MASDTSPVGSDPAPSFRTTLARVLSVQVVTLILLWILQSVYGG